MDALREQHERELRDAAEVRPACLPACLGSTACGDIMGSCHDTDWLRFPYVFIVLRSCYLHPHP